MRNISVVTNDGNKLLRGYTPRWAPRWLAIVTNGIRGGWNITHVPTGYRVTSHGTRAVSEFRAKLVARKFWWLGELETREELHEKKAWLEDTDRAVDVINLIRSPADITTGKQALELLRGNYLSREVLAMLEPRVLVEMDDALEKEKALQ